MSAKSLLYSGDLPYADPPGCGLGRQEVLVTMQSRGRLYRMVLRDKITIEDPYLVMVKATAFSIREGEAYAGKTPERSVRDFLIKSSVTI